jgi:hypothetical protein
MYIYICVYIYVYIYICIYIYVVKALKDMLRSEKLAVSGTKSELIDRLNLNREEKEVEKREKEGRLSLVSDGDMKNKSMDRIIDKTDGLKQDLSRKKDQSKKVYIYTYVYIIYMFVYMNYNYVFV